MGARQGSTRSLAAILSGVALAFLPGPVNAQTELRIFVADSLTSEPIEGALIELLAPDGSSIWRGVSGSDGRVNMRVAAGQVSVFTMMLGYQPIGPVTIEIPDQDWLRLRILLPPAPVPLESVDADVTRRSWPRASDRWGFEWRRVRRPYGEFLERGDDRLASAPTLSNLMRRTSGFRVQDRYTGNPVVYLRGSTFLRLGSVIVCGPTVYLNGIMVAEGGENAPVPIDDLVQVDQIEAMEVYDNPAEIPPEFKSVPNACGAIVIWTR